MTLSRTMRRAFILATAIAMASPLPARAGLFGSPVDAARQCLAGTTVPNAGRAALRACDRAARDARLDPVDHAATLVNRGILLMQAGRIAEAIADYDAAIAARPEMAEAYVNKGIALIKLGNHEAEAVTELTEGLARHPGKPEIAYYSRAMANETLGRIRAAYDDYRTAAALAPDWAEPAEQLQRFRIVRRKTADA